MTNDHGMRVFCGYTRCVRPIDVYDMYKIWKCLVLLSCWPLYFRVLKFQHKHLWSTSDFSFQFLKSCYNFLLPSSELWISTYEWDCFSETYAEDLNTCFIFKCCLVGCFFSWTHVAVWMSLFISCNPTISTMQIFIICDKWLVPPYDNFFLRKYKLWNGKMWKLLSCNGCTFDLEIYAARPSWFWFVGAHNN